MIRVVCSRCRSLLDLLGDEESRHEVPEPYVCKDCEQEERASEP